MQGTTFKYYCAQSADRQKKAKDSESGRDIRRMKRYECHGWLYVTIKREIQDDARVVIKHHMHHPRYTDISLPEKWQKFIRDNLNMLPSQVR